MTVTANRERCSAAFDRMECWKEVGGCDELDRWIDAHQSEIESAAFLLIANDRHYLYDDM